jgi:hypothetical protein
MYFRLQESKKRILPCLEKLHATIAIRLRDLFTQLGFEASREPL